jgi:hypothetical protein
MIDKQKEEEKKKNNNNQLALSEYAARDSTVFDRGVCIMKSFPSTSAQHFPKAASLYD